MDLPRFAGGNQRPEVRIICQLITRTETAQALDIPEATVRTRFFRARSLLREGLARDVDVALGDAFSFDGARCDRIVANVLAQLANGPESAGS